MFCTLVCSRGLKREEARMREREKKEDEHTKERKRKAWQEAEQHRVGSRLRDSRAPLLFKK